MGSELVFYFHKTALANADQHSYRLFPGWMKLILIRKVEDVAAVGLEEKNEPQRFETAFEGIPREAWHVFTDPSECLQIIKDAVAKED